MNKEDQLSLLETKDMNIVSFDELANILGGTSTQENEESHDKGKGQESGHAGGLICWC